MNQRAFLETCRPIKLWCCMLIFWFSIGIGFSQEPRIPYKPDPDTIGPNNLLVDLEVLEGRKQRQTCDNILDSLILVKILEVKAIGRSCISVVNENDTLTVRLLPEGKVTIELGKYQNVVLRERLCRIQSRTRFLWYKSD